MALQRTDDKLRLGGVCFAPKDPQSLVNYHLKNGFSAAFDPNVEDWVQMFEHFPDRQQGWARDYVYEQAAILGVPVRHADFREV